MKTQKESQTGSAYVSQKKGVTGTHQIVFPETFNTVPTVTFGIEAAVNGYTVKLETVTEGGFTVTSTNGTAGDYSCSITWLAVASKV